MLFQSQCIQLSLSPMTKSLFIPFSLFHKPPPYAEWHIWWTDVYLSSISCFLSLCTSFPFRPGVNPSLLHLAQTTHTLSGAAAAHQQRASVRECVSQNVMRAKGEPYSHLHRSKMEINMKLIICVQNVIISVYMFLIAHNNQTFASL